jgi:predicted MFS family arabinose efflux permease
LGAGLAIAACAAVAVAPILPLFLAAHVLVGLAFAALLSAGFAGVAAFPAERRAWAVGYVAGANALAWIVVSPLAGAVTHWLSWRAAQAVPATVALAALLGAHAAARVVTPQPSGALRTLFAARSARRWIGAELVAYAAWSSLLTFAGAFLIEHLGVHEAEAGWLLAIGAAAFFVVSTRSGLLARFVARRRLVVGAALVMSGLLLAQFTAGSVQIAVGIFFLICCAAGVRTPSSSALGLEQLPRYPAAMMAARTAATQLGYLLGAVIGGAMITIAGYEALGLVLAAAMSTSALLILRVGTAPELGELGEALPDPRLELVGARERRTVGVGTREHLVGRGA